MLLIENSSKVFKITNQTCVNVEHITLSVNSNLSVVKDGKMENRDGYSINFKSCSFAFICFLYFHFRPKSKKFSEPLDFSYSP